MSIAKENPEYQEYYDYLDALRESGVTNMFDAGAYVQREFGLSKEVAKKVVFSWMKEFSR